jgi:hypothetical protein
MRRRVDRAGEQRGVDFLGEQALAAGLGERTILDRIAGCSDDLERDPLDLPAMRLCEAKSRFACMSAKGEPRVPSVNKAGEVIGAA